MSFEFRNCSSLCYALKYGKAKCLRRDIKGCFARNSRLCVIILKYSSGYYVTFVGKHFPSNVTQF